MRKFLLAVVMVGAFGGMGAFFCFAVLAQVEPEDAAAVNGFPVEISDTPLRVLQVMEYQGPFLESPDVPQNVRCAAILVENSGGLYVSAGAVILQRQDQQLVFELWDLPPGTQALILEKEAQLLLGPYGWKYCGWAREEYPEQHGWLRYRHLPDGLAVTNISDQLLPVVELTYKRTGGESYIGGISFRCTLQNLIPGETKILPLPHYSQDRIDVVKEIAFYEN